MHLDLDLWHHTVGHGSVVVVAGASGTFTTRLGEDGRSIGDTMAPITSDCDAMRSPEHQMALITSDCAPSRGAELETLEIKMLPGDCFGSETLNETDGAVYKYTATAEGPAEGEGEEAPRPAHDHRRSFVLRISFRADTVTVPRVLWSSLQAACARPSPRPTSTRPVLWSGRRRCGCSAGRRGFGRSTTSACCCTSSR